MNGTKAYHREYGLKAGHAPIARRVVCVDFDNTLFPWGVLFNENAKPLPGAAEALRAFAEAGWHIVIFTSRMSRQWLQDAGENRDEHYAYIRDLCRKWDIPFNRILGEKIPAQVYIDDRAIEFTGTNWSEITERVLRL